MSPATQPGERCKSATTVRSRVNPRHRHDRVSGATGPLCGFAAFRLQWRWCYCPGLRSCKTPVDVGKRSCPGMHWKGRGLRGGKTGGCQSSYCRLQMPWKPALGVRGTVAGHRLGALEVGGGGAFPPFQCNPCSGLSFGGPQTLDQPLHDATGCVDLCHVRSQWQTMGRYEREGAPRLLDVVPFAHEPLQSATLFIKALDLPSPAASEVWVPAAAQRTAREQRLRRHGAVAGNCVLRLCHFCVYCSRGGPEQLDIRGLGGGLTAFDDAIPHPTPSRFSK